MKTQRMRTLLALLLLAGTAGGVSAEMFKCRQADGQPSFQQMPCDEQLQADPPPPRLMAPARAPAPAPAAAPARPSQGQPVALTRRKREVLELTAILQRCRADQEGFAERSGAVYIAWQRRHAVTLAEHDGLIAAKVREARRGAATVPLHLCTDDWLRNLEPLARMPDARFDTVEKTWSVFVAALKAADRETLLTCVIGRAETRWRQDVENLSDADLRRMGAAMRAFKVQWGDDYQKEALAARDDNRAGGITFQNLNEEWKISGL
jgi:hypothetical protein